MKSAVSLVKHIGMARTRGLGLVTMRLEDGDEQECKHVMFPSKQFYDRNKISYTIHLNSTLICKTETVIRQKQKITLREAKYWD